MRLYSSGNLTFLKKIKFLICRCYNFDDLSDQPIIQEDQAIMSFTLDQVSNDGEVKNILKNQQSPPD